MRFRSRPVLFRPGGADERTKEMNAYIDQHRDVYGVEPNVKMLQVAPSVYWHHASRERDPSRRSPRGQSNDHLRAHIQRVWQENHSVYGADKIWRQLNRESVGVARCTVERLMRIQGLQEVRRVKRGRARPLPMIRSANRLNWQSCNGLQGLNHQRLNSAIKYLPPAEAEANHYNQRHSTEKKRGYFNQIASPVHEAVQCAVQDCAFCVPMLSGYDSEVNLLSVDNSA